MPKVGMVSLGCPKNLVDSEVMLGLLARQGYELTPRAEEADVLVVNTCSFIEPAKQESINTILDMAEHKKSGTAKKLVVAGCLVERYRKEILKQFPEVDFVIGTNELERVLEACQMDAAGRESQQAAEPYLYHEFTPRILSTPSYSAYIKIAEGCDHPCTFCVIPQMRGRFRSRRFESVVREAEQLAAQGVREITLVGQDTTSYGEDLGLRDGLPLLLRELGEIPELAWVRFLYCYPNRVTEALIEAVAETPKVAKYFDIPLQHSSRAVLKAMRRGSKRNTFPEDAPEDPLGDSGRGPAHFPDCGLPWRDRRRFPGPDGLRYRGRVRSSWSFPLLERGDVRFLRAIRSRCLRRWRRRAGGKS